MNWNIVQQAVKGLNCFLSRHYIYIKLHTIKHQYWYPLKDAKRKVRSLKGVIFLMHQTLMSVSF